MMVTSEVPRGFPTGDNSQVGRGEQVCEMLAKLGGFCRAVWVRDWVIDVIATSA